MKLEALIEASLRSLYDDLKRGDWFGRENEVISLYVFAHLLPRVGDVPLHPSQLGIEVTVPQVLTPNHRRKRPDVRKDLVIWPAPRTTCWLSPTENVRYPAAVLEWKTRNNTLPRRSLPSVERDYEKDILWLQKFSCQAPRSFEGYAVFLDLVPSTPRFRVALVKQDTTSKDWLDLGAE